ncbi:MAG: leucyl aminopeptidase family protein [Bacteroidota bacterium]
MIQLSYHSGITGKSTVLLVGKKYKANPALSSEDTGFLKEFIKSDATFDFLRSAEGFVFFVKAEQSSEALRVAGSRILGTLSQKVTELFLDGDEAAVLSIAEGILLSAYRFSKYRKDLGKDKVHLETVFLPPGVAKKKAHELEQTVKAVFWARDMVNEPVNYLNAEKLAEEISTVGNSAGINVRTLGKTQIESLKMGGLLAVNKGSIDPPTFTIMEYKPEKPVNKKPVVLVGKGVVYDTGGLSLKPTPGSMDSMKCDMAGAAAVAGAVFLTALQKLNVHVIALIPATDNRPGMNAYTPGDIITMFDGTTVEVRNTDAEGRMILADALAYSGKYKPQLVISVATLTGAALRAIGNKACVAMGNAADKTFQQLEKAGETCHERIVRFPFWDEYAEEMKSPIADLNNLGAGNAGMITAGKFLEHFVKDPYIHLDIAGPAWLDTKQDYKGQGGTGTGVRLLYTYLKKLK